MNKLLIVDDEVDVREFTANFFRKRKFEVITAGGGKEALNIFEKERPDIIILDIKMDGMDGIEVLKSIREKDVSIPIVMVTGKEPQEDEALRKCEELGVRVYIHKPLELDKLEKAVTSVLK